MTNESMMIMIALLLVNAAMALWVIHERGKSKSLESTMDNYRERNKQLEVFESKCADLELKVKCMDMYINDDEAILELISASKPSINRCIDYPHAAYIAQRQAMTNTGGLGIGSLGSLGGMMAAAYGAGA